MNRLNQLFKEKNKNLLSVYFCAGAPAVEWTLPTLKALQEGGVDMVEIGIPFSDPMADGPVIQGAATQALKNGMSLNKLFEQLKDAPKEIKMPLVLMGYLNVIYKFGFEKFCGKCRECGIAGAIIPDLPFDLYIKEYKPIADKFDLRLIMLITPETSSERIRLIDENTDSFIYQVSTDSTTGAQRSFSHKTIEYFKRIKDMKLHNPTLIGFGISNKATFATACSYSFGGIIGSRFVKALSTSSAPLAAVAELLNALCH